MTAMEYFLKAIAWLSSNELLLIFMRRNEMIIKNYISRSHLSKNFFYTLSAIFLGIVLYYIGEWTYLINFTSKSVVYFLNITGNQAERHGDLIIIGDHGCKINKECAYIDWLLISMPLVLNCLRSPLSKFTVATALITIWYSSNILRIVLAIKFFLEGYRWFYCHDLPDYILWYLSLIHISEPTRPY